MTSLALLLNLAGFIGLCLAMPKHYRALLQATPSARLTRALRVLGWLGLLASFAALLQASGWHIGSVTWFGVSAVSTLTLIFLLPFLVRRESP